MPKFLGTIVMSGKPDLFISTSLNDKEAVQVLNELFIDAAQKKVEDVQLRFEGDVLKVEYVSHEVIACSEIEGPSAKIMGERIKSRAGISQTDFMTPRDGRFRLRYRKEHGWPIDRVLNLRVNIIPTDAGETFCIRLLAEMDDNLSLQTINMPHSVRNEFNMLLREQQGIFIVCGPVGSGKTTLLFSLLNALRKKGKNIKTIEDPVEIVMPGIDQMQVSTKLSFAQGIRAMLRQRVHVGLIGEVRDEDTAEAAFRAGNTGTLILFTIHADDPAKVISRCEDLGIDREAFAQSVRLIVFTRLIDTLPDGIDYPRVAPSDSAKNWLESAGLYDPNDRFIEVPETEFTSKTPLFEMIKISPDMRRAIMSERNASAVLEAAAKQPQYESLAEGAVRLAREGRTTLSKAQDLIGETVTPVSSLRLDKRLYNHGLITAQEQFACVQAWGQLRNEGAIVPLWKVIVDRGSVSLRQVIDYLGLESDAQNRIGYFIERGYIEHAAVAPVIKKWKDNGQKQSLFLMLVEHNLIDESQVYVEPLLNFRLGGMHALE